LPEVVLEEHRKIFKAIGARDSAGAGLAMKRHIKNSVERLRLK
jgi:DNA-binding FadR family transcriptional regulator